MNKVYVFDPTASDKQSAVRGIGRYLQVLKENFPEWNFINFMNLMNLKNSIYINPFFSFLQPPLTFKRLAKKQIAIIHDLIPLKYPSHFPAGIRGNINIVLNKIALKNYDLIITDSEASKIDIVSILRIDEKRIKVIYPCLPKVFSIQYSVSSMEKKNTKYEILNTEYCIYVGDATWNKNLVNLAHAIKLADVNCVFVGKVFESLTVDDRELKVGIEDRKAKIENQSSNLNPQPLSSTIDPLSSNQYHPWQKELKEFYDLTRGDKRFIFAGFVPDFDLIKLYQQATLNILPSRDEGFGFSYLESSQLRVPSLLSNIPVLKEVSGGNAIFFKPEFPEDIAEKIKKLFNDKKLHKEMGDKSYQRSLFFSQEKFKKEFLSILDIK
ncbi:MAG: Glycosyl transferase, group 1 [Candidatus Roizmanbacteria bacterium GW2011_GWA2_35_8]|uniref:Glycosyl transferase, group 1 n=1 Tax=Candidatus Roizmanbacteria bacterium GW2011_GWA2_35_8 TaxID=1618479 RepID=A0A0G0DBE8_9BACT|nr:MAG: Glycosyl transferase, group 1 [Candidatus Roizmanbacteria bacterium GW2011_GWA2_35_8]